MDLDNYIFDCKYYRIMIWYVIDAKMIDRKIGSIKIKKDCTVWAASLQAKKYLRTYAKCADSDHFAQTQSIIQAFDLHAYFL